MNSQLKERIAKLSSQQRQALEKRLKKIMNAASSGIEKRTKSFADTELSPQQRRLWTLAKLSPHSTEYNIPGVFKLTGQLDINKLQQAVQLICQRHQILKTVFIENGNGQLYQRMKEDFVVPFYTTEMKDTQQQNAIEQKLRNAVNIVFDMSKGPLWRAEIVQISANKAFLVLSMHHIIFDGWSLGIFVKELFDYYEKLCRNESVDLGNLDIQYEDYSDWQNQQLDKQSTKLKSYWKKALTSAPVQLELSRETKRQSNTQHEGALYELVLSNGLFNQSKTLAKQYGVTPFNLFYTVLTILLHRYTGQTDIVLGTPVSGRDERQTHPLIGLFVNTLPVRVIFSKKISFVELMKQVRLEALDAFAHGDLPFDSIVETVNPVRVLGCNPLFQVLYTYQNKIPPIAVNDLLVEYETVDAKTAKFDLSLDVFESSEGLSCLFEYDTKLFTAEKIARMAKHFENLLNTALANPEMPIYKMDYLTNDEKAMALRYVNNKKYLPNPVDMATLFEKQVANQPDSSCVVYKNTELSYRDVADQVSEILPGLLKILHNCPSFTEQQRSSKPVIAICMERSEDLITALLSILKTGSAFVILDPSYPKERLKFIVEDSAAVMIIADDTIPFSNSDVVVEIKKVEDIIAINKKLTAKGRQEVLATLPSVQLDDNAFTVYTSGTTGQPKGISISHRNWFNAFYGWQLSYDLNGTVRNHLQIASQGFDVFCGDFIRALGSGGKLVICPHNLFGNPEALFQLIEQENIHCAEFVPAIFRELAGWLEDNNKKLSNIKILIVASDAWYAREYQHFLSLCGTNSRLINSYGMAEASIDSTWYEANRSDKDFLTDEQQQVPVGKPFANVEVMVLDKDLQLLAPEIAGEICISGYGLANGYNNRDELNAEKFIPHPFATDKSQRLYKTGDLGLMRIDGNIELLGRKDLQVKIRGQRIELGEIETALGQLENVDQAIANVICEDDTNQSIVAYYICKNSSQLIDESIIREHLQNWIPAYMIPAYFEQMTSFPLSANGKVDRQALPQPKKKIRSMESSFVSPATLNQEILAGIWCQIMMLPRVGIYDSFFELGGHSLMAIQIIARIDECFGVELPLHALFSYPTIAALEKQILITQGQVGINKSCNENNDMPMAVPDVDNLHEPFPLTDVQQAYWIGRNQAFVFGNVNTHSYDELDAEDLDPIRFQRAWNKVIERHDMLRAIVNDDGMQQILKEVPEYHIKVVDLQKATADKIDDATRKMRGELSHQKLDVHQWPVFDIRATLLPDNKARLHFSTDALIWDAWSFVILIKDVVQFYLDETLPVIKPTLSFRDYVLAENQLSNSQSYAKSLTYWSERVSDLPPAPQLPIAKDPATINDPVFTRIHRKMNREMWEKLKLKTTKVGMTSTGITLAAYAEILKLYAQDPRFSLNLTFLNRHPLHPDVNDIVGEFTSLTLLSVDTPENQSFTERARKIQSDLWHDIEYHYISGVHILRELTRHHGGATEAKMPVVFTSALIVPIPERKHEFEVALDNPANGITQTSQVWLDCGVWEDESQLLCNWDVALDVYPEGMIEEMFEAYWTLLCKLATEDDIWQSDIVNVLDSKKSLQPLPITAPRIEKSLVSLFTEQVANTPGNMAVIDERKELSYRELSDYVAHLQKRILQNGCQSQELIAVVMSKGWEQAVATLAIMSAGAAYVPIDPGLPDERIAYLLKHCDVKQVITQAEWSDMIKQHGDYHLHIIRDDELIINQQLRQDCLPKTDDLAYVIFTSGSTGQPKGVMIDHRGAVNTVLDVNEHFSVCECDRILAVSALNFDLSVYDLFGTFATGAAVVFPENDRRLDPLHWLDLLIKHKISLWNSVPALAGLLTDYAESCGKQLTTLRAIMMSGDWIPLNLPERLNHVCDEIDIVSMGGATEASIWSIIYPIKQLETDWKSIPYGKAMTNQSFHVLDCQLEPCPDWVAGELFIGGIGLALGYWKDEEKTNNSFIIHPRTSARLYRTGDLGCRAPDGNIEILGRTDFQVKIQGHRIELGEIEAAINQFPTVKESVVVAAGEQKGDKRLVAYVVAKSNKNLEIGNLQRNLRNKLPNYMVPSLLEIDKLPLSANGKVDRKALPKLEKTNLKVEQVAPSSEAELALFQVWTALLNNSDFGIDDDFFLAGGDSMLVIQLLTKLYVEYGVRLTLAQIYANHTIREQATFFNEAKNI